MLLLLDVRDCAGCFDGILEAGAFFERDVAVTEVVNLKRFAVPTPMMEPDTTCVVETGKWSNVAEKMTMEELNKSLMD